MAPGCLSLILAHFDVLFFGDIPAQLVHEVGFPSGEAGVNEGIVDLIFEVAHLNISNYTLCFQYLMFHKAAFYVEFVIPVGSAGGRN